MLAEWQFPRSLLLIPLVLEDGNLVVTSGPYHLKVLLLAGVGTRGEWCEARWW